MLPQHEWLPHAKALAVGMKNRITHRNERRPNLVVGNAHDRFWAYCQACREGAVLEKDTYGSIWPTWNCPVNWSARLMPGLCMAPTTLWQWRTFLPPRAWTSARTSHRA